MIEATAAVSSTMWVKTAWSSGPTRSASDRSWSHASSAPSRKSDVSPGRPTSDNGGFFAAAPGGTCTAQDTPFDCNNDGTIAADEAVTMKLEGRAPFVEMPSDAQGYDMVLEGLALTLVPKKNGSCVLSGPAACLSGQSKSGDPVDAAKTPVFLGGSRLSMRFVQPSNEHVREAEDNYGWAHEGNNICHSYGSDTPLTMLNEVELE